MRNYSVPVTVIDKNPPPRRATKPTPKSDIVQSKRAVAQAVKKPSKPISKPQKPAQSTPRKTPITKKTSSEKQPNSASVRNRTSTAQIAPWQQYAIRAPAIGNRPAIAVVIDDLGIDQRRTRRTISLPGPLTLALMPYGYNLAKHAKQARAQGHELLVHLPMEPLDPGANPGKNALLTSLTKNELKRRLIWNLSQFRGFVGVNNHMGSKFTAWPEGMQIVMQTLRRRGLMFLDSKTTTKTQGFRLARLMQVPHTVRDVFLDNNITEEAIEQQFRQLESVARRNGSAIGIGHPYDETIAVLRRWIPAMRKKGFVLVPVTAIVRRKPLSG
ncbi:MAG TPA: divergent polysaccharide deacetylase family protein [Rhodospirillaceae bacterium]|nr:divergent polysaccharide deacetylase family protein [Rhodospirillaceae bacterium]